MLGDQRPEAREGLVVPSYKVEVQTAEVPDGLQGFTFGGDEVLEAKAKVLIRHHDGDGNHILRPPRPSGDADILLPDAHEPHLEKVTTWRQRPDLAPLLFDPIQVVGKRVSARDPLDAEAIIHWRNLSKRAAVPRKRRGGDMRYSAGAVIPGREIVPRLIRGEVMNSTRYVPGAAERIGLEMLKVFDDPSLVPDELLTHELFSGYARLLTEYRRKLSTVGDKTLEGGKESYYVLPEQSALCEKLLDLLEKYPEQNNLGREAIEIFSQVELSSAMAERLLWIMDSRYDLGDPIVFRLSVQLAMDKRAESSPWLAEQDRRIAHFETEFEALTPQERFDNFPKFALLASKIVYAGGLRSPMDGKIGMEVEHGKSGKMTNPPGFVIGNDFLGNEELRRNDNGLMFDLRYLADLAGLAPFFRVGAEHVSDWHIHLDKVRHPHKPIVPGLDHKYSRGNILGTWEIRGFLPPTRGSVGSTEIDPAVMANTVLLLIRRSYSDGRERTVPGIELPREGKCDARQLIYGCLQCQDSSAVTALALLKAMENPFATVSIDLGDILETYGIDIRQLMKTWTSDNPLRQVSFMEECRKYVASTEEIEAFVNYVIEMNDPIEAARILLQLSHTKEQGSRLLELCSKRGGDMSSAHLVEALVGGKILPENEMVVIDNICGHGDRRTAMKAIELLFDSGPHGQYMDRIFELIRTKLDANGALDLARHMEESGIDSNYVEDVLELIGRVGDSRVASSVMKSYRQGYVPEALVSEVLDIVAKSDGDWPKGQLVEALCDGLIDLENSARAWNMALSGTVGRYVAGSLAEGIVSKTLPPDKFDVAWSIISKNGSWSRVSSSVLEALTTGAMPEDKRAEAWQMLFAEPDDQLAVKLALSYAEGKIPSEKEGLARKVMEANGGDDMAVDLAHAYVTDKVRDDKKDVIWEKIIGNVDTMVAIQLAYGLVSGKIVGDRAGVAWGRVLGVDGTDSTACLLVAGFYRGIIPEEYADNAWQMIRNVGRSKTVAWMASETVRGLYPLGRADEVWGMLSSRASSETADILAEGIRNGVISKDRFNQAMQAIKIGGGVSAAQHLVGSLLGSSYTEAQYLSILGIISRNGDGTAGEMLEELLNDKLFADNGKLRSEAWYVVIDIKERFYDQER